MFNKKFRLTSIILAAAIVVTSVVGNDAISVSAAPTETAVVAEDEAGQETVEAEDEAEESTKEDVKSEVKENTVKDTKESAEEDGEEVSEVKSEEEATEEEATEDALGEESVEAAEAANEDIVYVEGRVDEEFVPTREELTQFGYKPSSITVPESVNVQDEDSIESIIPRKYDAREGNGYVSPVRNQDPYGTCWAFATMGATEAGMMSNGYKTSEDNQDYSEKHLAWLFYNLENVNDPLGNTEGDKNYVLSGDGSTKLPQNAYEMGGNFFESTIVLSKWIGAVSEDEKEEYKYPVVESGKTATEVAEESKITLDTATVYNAQAHLQNTRYICLSQPEEVKRAIMKYGTLFFDYGHYFADRDNTYNFETIGEDGSYSYYFPFDTGINHSVTVVGWDDDYSRDKFDSYCTNKNGQKIHYKPKNNGAWLIRNSWGTGALQDGYMWISYEDGTIGSSVAVFDSEPADNYDNNYFYDGGNGDAWAYDDTKAVANVYTAKGNSEGKEELQAVGVLLTSSDINYKIQVYKLTEEQLASGNPTSGEPLLSEPQTGRTTFAGYYTIPLEQTVILSEGDIFAVVFSSDEAFSTIVDTEIQWSTYDDYGNVLYTEIHHNAMKRGQSFAILDGSNEWQDGIDYDKTEDEDRIQEVTYRVHAYTDKVDSSVIPTSPSLDSPTSITFTNVPYEEGTPKSISLEAGEYYDIRTQVQGVGSFEKGIVWSSSDSNVATVDSTGHVVAVKGGKATITATSKASEDVKCSVDVYVLGDLSVSVLNPYSTEEEVITNNTLYYDFSTENAVSVNCTYGNVEYTPGLVEWSSSNSMVASFEDSSNGELTIYNPGYTEIQVTVDHCTSAKYAITVLPTSVREREDSTYANAFDLRYKLKLSGQIDLSWPDVNKVVSYKVVDQSRKTYYSCASNTDGDGYSCNLKNYVGKNIPNAGLKLNVIGTFKFYQTASRIVNKDITSDYVSFTADEFNNRGINLKLDIEYPKGVKPDEGKPTYDIRKPLYKDNVLMFSPLSLEYENGYRVFEKSYYGYGFDGWVYIKNGEEDASISIKSGELINTFFADYVIFDSGSDVDYNDRFYEFVPKWSELKVDDVKLANGFDDGFTEEAISVKSGTKVILECDTPGAMISYFISTDKDADTSGRAYESYSGPIVLEYIKDNPEDPDSVVKYIFAKATKAGYSGSNISNIFEAGYKITAVGYDWGTIPASDYTSDNFPYKDNPAGIPEGIWAYGYENLSTYDGQAITFPDLKVFYYKTPLVLGTDYTVKYSNNVNKNTAYSENGYKTDGLTTKEINSLPTLTITGKGSYSGTKKIYFSIAPLDISFSGVTITNDGVLTYNDGRGKINPVVQYKNGKTGKVVTLRLNKDYKVDFSSGVAEDPDNPSPDYKTEGKYYVTVTGIGNFDGSRSYTINVYNKANTIFMSSASVGRLANVPYSGDVVHIANNDFVVKSGRNPLTLTTKPEPESDTVDGNYYVEYEEGADYTNIGTKTITLVGTGKEYNGIRVIGEKKVTFNIVGRQMNKVTVTGIPKSVVYNRDAWTIEDEALSNITLTYKVSRTQTDTLTIGVDYTISYDKNINAGTATIIFTGKGNYAGTVKKTFKINSVDLAAAGNAIVFKDSAEELPHFRYDKNGSKPSISVGDLIEGKDYTVKYQNNTAVNDGVTPKKKPTIVVTGKGNYKGTLTRIFAIDKRELSDDNIGITSTDTYGGNYNSSITLYDKNANNAKLKAGTDYDKNIVYSYVNETDVQVKVGKLYRDEKRGKGVTIRKGDIIPNDTLIRATVTGKNNYEGAISTIFRICKYNISKASFKFTVASYSYNGYAVEPDFYDIEGTYKIGKETRPLEDGNFEIIGYSNNNKAGYGLVTIRGKGDFGGTATIKFKINAATLIK